MNVAGDSERVYGGRALSDRRAERRRRFLAAGLAVIGEKGYAATSVADICAAAGLARSQFYDEFPNREKLLLDVYDAVQDDARDAVIAALAAVENGDRRALVTAAITALIDSLGSDPRRARVSYLEMLGVSDAVEQHRSRRRVEWATFIEATLRTELGGDFVPPGGHEFAATAFIGPLTELISTWSRMPGPRPPVGGIVDTMVAVLGAFVPDLDAPHRIGD
ncbi:transcriptional regulator, TetR family [Rhodococcoides kroppenstedtii]|uniref:Transcriptional regulator, TetR family n=1 Tax=Rhodococcoides kroppenstedtii TaxID=293050 RepID=A0A1I0T180_9NOCA|nr:TetR/AcrR family transcriptional regulator [Rhodococcus kroppenstedtii]SFA44786.1 transcriptional regulator, TetR family [Rhodococcus kroppenstedtii]